MKTRRRHSCDAKFNEIMSTLQKTDIILEDFHDEESRLCLTDLPDEILLKIFFYLKTSEVLNKVSLVCKHFYRLSQDPSVIKEIFLKPNTINDTQLGDVTDAISRSRNLISLTMRGTYNHCMS